MRVDAVDADAASVVLAFEVSDTLLERTPRFRRRVVGDVLLGERDPRAFGCARRGARGHRLEALAARGPIGQVGLTFLKNFTRFEDRAEDATEPGEAF